MYACRQKLLGEETQNTVGHRERCKCRVQLDMAYMRRCWDTRFRYVHRTAHVSNSPTSFIGFPLSIYSYRISHTSRYIYKILIWSRINACNSPFFHPPIPLDLFPSPTEVNSTHSNPMARNANYYKISIKFKVVKTQMTQTPIQL